MFSIFSLGKKLQIKTKNYVGVIETSKGLTLEILPKIFLIILMIITMMNYLIQKRYF